jgi:7-carboxy-7-deazaguanine synthase
MSTSALPVMEHFYTIQGEGANTGKAAYFIRLAGCDVGCVWCDVKESWKAEDHQELTIDKLLEFAKQQPSRLAVITGGEPFIYNLNELTALLKKNEFKLCVETSGAYPVSGVWDWICVSPKKFKFPLPETLKSANELKVIIYNKSDFKWAEQNAALTDSKCLLMLQPEYSRFETMMPMIVDYVKNHPKWQISLQTHKIINVP